jgi:hypothetical protein
MSELPTSTAGGVVGSSAAPGYAPLVPTYSPYTSDPRAAVRLAWRVMLGSFAVLVALLIGGPLARNWYVSAAVESRSGEMDPIDGVVFLRRQGTGDWFEARPDEVVNAGDVLRTAQNARAFVTLFDHSTILLYPSSTLRLLRTEQGRFRTERRTAVLELTQGRARLGVAPPADESLSFFQVLTPHAGIHLQEGSYSLDVTPEGTQVLTRLGEAVAHTTRGQATANRGQRLVAYSDQPPAGNLEARRDLVANSLFAERDRQNPSWPAHWSVRTFLVDPGPWPEGTVSLDARAGAVTFRRQGLGHSTTMISQPLNMILWDFEKVTLTAQIRVLQHSLSGGGWLGTEYPIILKLHYRDTTDTNREWYQGFYLHNRDGYPTVYGRQLPSTDWQTVEIDLLALQHRPVRIDRVEVQAQGWDYESVIRELHIWAR